MTDTDTEALGSSFEYHIHHTKKSKSNIYTSEKQINKKNYGMIFFFYGKPSIFT